MRWLEERQRFWLASADVCLHSQMEIMAACTERIKAVEQAQEEKRLQELPWQYLPIGDDGKREFLRRFPDRRHGYGLDPPVYHFAPGFFPEADSDSESD